MPEKKHVSEAINYIEDIEPHWFVEIFAGVGSGKNTFIENLIKGHKCRKRNGEEEYVPPKSVLLITSRRAKVNETLTEDDLPIDGSVGRWDAWRYHREREENPDLIPMSPRTIRTGWGDNEVYTHSVVCTNAFIEKYLKYRHNPDDPTTHLWNLFDIIVVDEIHSLVLDATYQTAPFYVSSLINEFIFRYKRAQRSPKRCKAPLCKHLILMTGSPDPITGLIKPRDTHTINLFDECINVVPHNIHFITAEAAKAQICRQLEQGERVMYFTNHVTLPEAFCEDTNIAPEVVAVSFSKKEKREAFALSDPLGFRRMERTEDMLTEKSLLPDDIKLFISTSRNKEGINIENKDIPHLYVESRNRSDIIQSAGRIRCGVEHMYLVIDSSAHNDNSWDHEADFSQTKIAGKISYRKEPSGVANEYLHKLCAEYGTDNFYNAINATTYAYKQGNEHIARLIDFIHARFDYVRYCYLSNVFSFYELKTIGEAYQERYSREFRAACENHRRYAEMLQEWFPTSVVHPYTLPEAQANAYLNSKLEADPNRIFTSEEIDQIRQDLNSIFGTSYAQIGHVLARFTDLRAVRRSRTRGRPGYDQLRFEASQGR